MTSTKQTTNHKINWLFYVPLAILIVVIGVWIWSLCNPPLINGKYKVVSKAQHTEWMWESHKLLGINHNIIRFNCICGLQDKNNPDTTMWHAGTLSVTIPDTIKCDGDSLACPTKEQYDDKENKVQKLGDNKCEILCYWAMSGIGNNIVYETFEPDSTPDSVR